LKKRTGSLKKRRSADWLKKRKPGRLKKHLTAYPF
jgi:hypothetical protein